MDKEINNELEIFRFLDVGNKESAARLIYKLYFEDAIAFYEALGGKTEDAEDLIPYMVMNFFEKYYAGKYVKSEKASLKTYLFTVLKFQFYKKLRDNKEISVPEFPIDVADNELDISNLLIEEEMKKQQYEIFDSCMKSLNENCRCVISMYYYDKFSTSKIADIMGYGNSRVVITTKNRCMNLLKECCLSKN